MEKSLIKRYAKLLNSSQKRRVFLCLLFILLGGFLEAFGISLFVPLLIAIINVSFFEQFEIFQVVVQVFGLKTDTDIVLFLLTVLLVLILLKNIVVYSTNIFQRKFILQSCMATSSSLFALYLEEDYEELMGRNSNDMAADVVSVVNKIYLLLEAMLWLLAEAVVATFLIIVMFIIDWRITLIFAGAFALVLFAFRKGFHKKARALGALSNECYSFALKCVNEGLSGVKEVQLMGRQPYFYNSYRRNSQLNVDLEVKKTMYQAAPRHVTEVVFFLAAAAVAGVSVVSSMDSSLLVAQLSAISVAAVRLVPSMNRINESANAIAFYSPALDKVDEQFINKIKSEKKVAKADIQAMNLTDRVEVKNVTYTYPNTEDQVLVDANMVVEKGQMVGIVGSSGAGKTTLVDIILGFLTPSSGSVECDGKNIFDDVKSWTANIGYIPQMIFIMDDSIRSNVAFGSEDMSDERIWIALEKAQLADFVKTLPEGLDTRLGDRGIRLSGGQRQRIGIARALYSDPEILVFDEATSALDKQTEDEVMKSVYSLGSEKTMIIIAHNTRTLSGCDHVFKVESGRIYPADEVLLHG